mgnify:CR=1 FL=1|tara:strand:- start:175 stop:705 length:531 start_codon:yes stop_codon:yes gene_type:complete
MANSVTLTVTLSKVGTKIYDYRFIIDEQLALPFIDGKNRRVICTFNQKEIKHCALMPSPEGPFIMADQQLRKKLGIQEGDEIIVEIRKDESEYGMPVPEEFSACLEMDPEADSIFKKLSNGKQRTLIHLVGKIKSSEIKVRRTLAILDHLKREPEMKDYKGLNETIKEYNRRENLF